MANIFDEHLDDAANNSSIWERLGNSLSTMGVPDVPGIPTLTNLPPDAPPDAPPPKPVSAQPTPQAQPDPLSAPPIDTQVAVKEPPRSGDAPVQTSSSAPRRTLPEDAISGLALNSAIHNVDFSPAEKAQIEGKRSSDSEYERVKSLLAQRTKLLQDTSGGRQAEQAANVLQSIPLVNLFAAPIARGVAAGINRPLDDFDRANPEIAKMQGQSPDQLRGQVLRNQQEAQADDPSSPITQQAVQFISAAGGVDPKMLQGLTARSLVPLFQHVVGLPAQERAHVIQAAVEKLKLAEEARNHNLEHQDRQAQIAATAQKEKDLHGRMPAELVQQNSGAGAGAQALLSAADNFDKVGGFGLVGSDSSKYKSEAATQALSAAIGLNPRARESLSAKIEGLADTYLPSAGQTRGVGFSKIGNNLLQTARASQERIRALKAAGYDTTPLEVEHQQVLKAVNAFTRKYGKELSKSDLHALSSMSGPQVVQTVTKNGKQYSQLDNGQWVEH